MLRLRQLSITDECSFRSAIEEFTAEGEDWEFAFQYDPEEDFAQYLERVKSWENGIEGFVPASYLVAEVEGEIVGRASIRHCLNDFLRLYGGHIGYGVVPSKRRKGYATEILKQSIEFCEELRLHEIMISCDVGNIGSRKVIEANGGIFERVTDLEDVQVQKQIYWIRG